MDYQVVLSPSAIRDLRDIVRFISLDSSRKASEFGNFLVSHTKALGRFPEMGREVPETGNPLCAVNSTEYPSRRRHRRPDSCSRGAHRYFFQILISYYSFCHCAMHSPPFQGGVGGGHLQIQINSTTPAFQAPLLGEEGNKSRNNIKIEFTTRSFFIS